MKRRPNCQCFVCKKEIYRRPSQITAGNVYCSLTCTGQSQQKSKVCKICQQKYVGSKKTCSRACANKARTGISYTKESAFNKAYQGTLLKEKIARLRGGVCERCNEDNYAILQIHHKVERYKGGTNDLNNLELLCPNCHTTHHLGRSLFKNKKNATVSRTIK